MEDGFRERMDVAGFSCLGGVFTSDEIDYCDNEITSLMGKKNFAMTLMKSDMSNNPGSGANQQVELIRPALFSLKLRRSEVFRRCYDIAKEYYGGKAHYLFDHAIYKMPRSSTVTHWHQDQAYLDARIMIPSIHFWIPFQDTNAGNGAMQFVAGSHKALLKHEPAYINNPGVLKVVNEPRENIVVMDIMRGSMSVHTNLTLHASMANQSNQTRKAWIIHFGQKSELHKRWLKLGDAVSKIFKPGYV